MLHIHEDRAPGQTRKAKGRKGPGNPVQVGVDLKAEGLRSRRAPLGDLTNKGSGKAALRAGAKDVSVAPKQQASPIDDVERMFPAEPAALSISAHDIDLDALVDMALALKGPTTPPLALDAAAPATEPDPDAVLHLPSAPPSPVAAKWTVAPGPHARSKGWPTRCPCSYVDSECHIGGLPTGGAQDSLRAAGNQRMARARARVGTSQAAVCDRQQACLAVPQPRGDCPVMTWQCAHPRGAPV